jgi:hypothetical protein
MKGSLEEIEEERNSEVWYDVTPPQPPNPSPRVELGFFRDERIAIMSIVGADLIVIFLLLFVVHACKGGGIDDWLVFGPNPSFYIAGVLLIDTDGKYRCVVFFTILFQIINVLTERIAWQPLKFAVFDPKATRIQKFTRRFVEIFYPLVYSCKEWLDYLQKAIMLSRFDLGMIELSSKVLLNCIVMRYLIKSKTFADEM